MALATFVVLSFGVMLAGCGPTHTTQAIVTPSPSTTAAPVVLYQADFGQGLAAWHASDGWSITAGQLRSDAGEKRSLTIPYVAPTGDYTVELLIQVIEVPRDGGYFVLAADPAANADGYSAGIQTLRAPGPRPPGDHPSASTWIVPQDHQDLASYQVIDFEPYTRPRLYRVAVRGDTVAFSADGHTVSHATTVAASQLSSGPLHLDCAAVALAIIAVRVSTP